MYIFYNKIRCILLFISLRRGLIGRESGSECHGTFLIRIRVEPNLTSLAWLEGQISIRVGVPGAADNGILVEPVVPHGLLGDQGIGRYLGRDLLADHKGFGGRLSFLWSDGREKGAVFVFLFL